MNHVMAYILLVCGCWNIFAALTVHYEFSSPIEFDVDEEFVDMVHAYFKRKIAEKEEELKAI